MHIIIPTMARLDLQHTYNNIAPYSPYPVLLAAPADEAPHHKGRNVFPIPMHIRGIAATRQYIMRKIQDDHIVMMDDDLRFYRRRKDDPTKFSKITPIGTAHMLRKLKAVLHQHAHTGIAMREGANRNIDPTISCTRCARVIGYHRPTFLGTKVDFRNSEVMDDFEATLHLITHGYPNVVINSYVQNQTGSGTKGGAAEYRTLEVHAASARRLAERYPDYVKTREKTTKTAWNGQTRLDVVVQWKRAYQDAIQRGMPRPVH